MGYMLQRYILEYRRWQYHKPSKKPLVIKSHTLRELIQGPLNIGEENLSVKDLRLGDQ